MPRVLVIRGGAVGDFIVTLPAIRCLKESIPDCHLELLGYENIAQLAVAADYADAVRSLEHRSMALLFVPGAALAPELEAWLKSFHVVVSYLYDPDDILRGNMQRIGVKTFLAMPHRVVDGAGYAAEQLATPLQRLALFVEDPLPRIRPVNALPLVPQRVALHPGSGGLKKTWPLERWLRLGRVLAAEGREVVLITGEAEAERGVTEEILREWADVRFEHWDSLPLAELARHLSSCALFIGHDSGVSHLADACGLRTLWLFGPSSAATWAPSRAEVLQAPSDDLGALSYEAVFEKVQLMVGESAHPHRA